MVRAYLRSTAMESFVAVVHILVAFSLILLVLLQDSKSGSVGGAFGGGGSSSILGATGAATLAQKLTRWIALIFAATSISLSFFASKTQKSVMDSAAGASVPAAAAPATPTPPSASPSATQPAPGTPAATSPTVPAATTTH